MPQTDSAIEVVTRRFVPKCKIYALEPVFKLFKSNHGLQVIDSKEEAFVAKPLDHSWVTR
jgi:hypothetical protein